MNPRLMLANVDYKSHTTSEGDEIQEGMQAAGWRLCGTGYDGRRDVKQILDAYQPSAVFVADKRDFDPHCGAFRKDVNFLNLGALSKWGGFKTGIVKDAGSLIEYHRAFIEEIGASAVVNYYHRVSVLKKSPWLARYPLIRVYHSIDVPTVLRAVRWGAPRINAVASGAVSNAYPLRQRVFRDAGIIGCDLIHHPGYSNRKTHTPDYLKQIAGYKVHIATASAYGFALRKIIESVAVGTIPITDLPYYDELPEIDGALVRIPHDSSAEQVRDAVHGALAGYNEEARRAWAQKALGFYSWQNQGARLNREIEFEMKLRNFRL